MEFVAAHWLDIVTTVLGLAYILFEYKASAWMWVVGFFMQSLGIVLFYQKGLYADCGMEFYYLAMTMYGWWRWVKGTKEPTQTPTPSPSRTGGELSQFSPQQDYTNAPPVREGLGVGSSTGEEMGVGVCEEDSSRVVPFPRRLLLPVLTIFMVVWGLIFWWLATSTNSNVPLADSFTTALSIIGIWALARKYLEQWFVWIVVDVVSSVLYFYKDIPFKGGLYALYVVIAIMGYRKWKRMMKSEE